MANTDKSNFDLLRRHPIRLAVQLTHMHFNLTYVARYTMPKVIIANVFTKAEADPQMLKPNWAQYIFHTIKTNHSSKVRGKGLYLWEGHKC